jgi:hypothetical protein
MTVLEKFMAFAEALSSAERQEIEALLASIMDAHAGEFDLTVEELAELDRRLADPNREYADPAEIEAIFRRYRKA